MAIFLQQLTIYLYSAHRAVIFAIAQLSCFNVMIDHTAYFRHCSANVTGVLLTVLSYYNLWCSGMNEVVVLQDGYADPSNIPSG